MAILALAAFAPVLAAGNNLGVAVIVVAGDLSIRDFAEPSSPCLSRLLENASPGLMNVRAGRPSRDVEPTDEPGMESQCVTLGAGTMAVGGAEARRAFEADEKPGGQSAASIYASRVGKAGSEEVLHTEIAWMRRANDAASYRARPGALGSALRAAGLRTAVIGNSDTADAIHREAVCIAADERGLVDLGCVNSSELYVVDPTAPFGFRSDPRALLAEFDRVVPSARLIVIDFGDTFRAGRYARFSTDDRAALLRYQAIVRLDAFLESLLGRLDYGRDLLIVLSPSPRPLSDLEGERLTPVICRGPGFSGGMLTSPSTRIAGVVTISDVAPTVLSFLGVDVPPDMQGRPIESAPSDDAVEALLQVNLDAARQTQRQPIMRGASVAQSIVVVIVTVAVLLGAAGAWREIARWLSLVPAALPLTMLYLPLIYNGGLPGAVAVISLLTLAVVAFFRLALRPLSLALGALCALTAASLAVDILLGAPLISSSIAGYSIAEGARYYGIGNELMGTMLGASLVALGLLLSRSRLSGSARAVVTVAVAVAVFALIGLPALGANVGGAIAALAAGITLVLVRRGRGVSPKALVAVAAVMLVVLAALFAVDLMRGADSQSHAGRAAGLAADGGVAALLLVFQRKLALNSMLLSTSLWSRLLLLSLIGSAALWALGRRRWGKLFLDSEQAAAATAAVVGTAAAFAFNDSGVVAAATCAVLLWALLAVRCLSCGDQKDETGERALSGAQV